MILIGLITSQQFCEEIFPLIKREHFESRHSQRVFEWLKEGWDATHQPLGKAIEQVYQDHSERLPEEESRLISRMLGHLSERFADDQITNWPYHIDRTRTWLQRRSLEVLTDRIGAELKRGRVQEALATVQNFGSTASRGLAYKWVSPFTDVELQQRIASGLDNISGIFQFDGALGRVLGPWDRGWLVAYFGPMKRGKTWWLTETGGAGVVQGLRVSFFTLEMKLESMSKRSITNVTGLVDRPGEIRIPVWDCAQNQDDSCDLPERANDEPAPVGADKQIVWDENSAYKPCDFCRRNPEGFLQNYRPATWFKTIEKSEDEIFANGIIKKSRAFADHYHGGNLKVSELPRFEGTIDDVEAILQRQEAEEGHVPDMIVIDYADILNGPGRDDRERLDIIWKRLAAMATKRNCIVVTASQTTRKSIERRSIKQTDIAEDIRKLAHIDVGISLNQEETERNSMVMRVGVMAHRHREHPGEEVFCLQSLNLGMPVMDTFTASETMAEHIAGEGFDD